MLLPTGELEIRRLALQVKLDKGKSQAERNRLGQFPTPFVLATDILRQAKSLLQPDTTIRFMDPAFGTGPFYSALLQVFPGYQIARASGYEIDPYYASETTKLWSATQLNLTTADFTMIEAPDSNDEKPNLIVCNPPYVRHHHLHNGEKIRLQRRVERVAGIKLSGLAGLYCYFMALCHAWLAEEGLAAWLVPSEFMDVNYGKEVKDYLLNKVTLLRIHRFDPLEVQFDDALVSSVVVWFRKALPPEEHKVAFTLGGTLLEPKSKGMISTNRLRLSSKWTPFPARESSAKLVVGNRDLKLADLFNIKRGIATGNNNYFILTKEQIRSHSLPERFLIPILPSPRYLHVDEVQAAANGDPLIDKQLFLLSCDLPEAEVRRSFPSLWQYYQSGVDAKINELYLCKHRKPWYAQEERPPTPFLCTYMGRNGSRDGTQSSKPFRFILNHSNATAANVYLMLYAKPFLATAIAGRPERTWAIWKALSGIQTEELTDEGRVYGGGLHKMEPKELGNVSATRVLSALPELNIKPQSLFDFVDI